MINKNDERLKVNLNSREKNKQLYQIAKKNREKGKSSSTEDGTERKTIDGAKIQRVEKVASHLFFKYNTQLGPPYKILIDTNFINFAIQNKLDLFTSMMDCLLAKCIPIITDCVMAELEKLGTQYRRKFP